MDTTDVSGRLSATPEYAPCTRLTVRCTVTRKASTLWIGAWATSIRCRAAPVKLGRTLCVYHVVLLDDADTVVASGDFTYFMSVL